MMWKYGMLFLLLFASCQYERTIQPAFYYWKTQYQRREREQATLNKLDTKQLFVRIMDVDLDETGLKAIPVSPIVFKNKLPDSIDVVPVVYIVNNVLKQQSEQALTMLANRILSFTEAKVKQGGKNKFTELQIDCDWTQTTRETYFSLLKKIKALTSHKTIILSATLRLHQIKNRHSSGIPPVDKVLLMCYNMGNLRKYGTQNSILDEKEMAIYLKDFLPHYPLPVDIALPLFSWSVVFRDQQYVGISKHLDSQSLTDTNLFYRQGNTSLYHLKKELPKAGLRVNDVIRREEVNIETLFVASDFLSRYLPRKDLKVVFYHLDAALLNRFSDEQLQEIIDRF
ncbi:hypothetical protein RYH73_04300 [Olivibacter sp. CPCC 100613]|uniref:hypothetical protein n=1 Tax=Olivibacter sp. CPCC 100613 TaxID=3079931 RepID=UPI002FFA5959